MSDKKAEPHDDPGAKPTADDETPKTDGGSDGDKPAPAAGVDLSLPAGLKSPWIVTVLVAVILVVVVIVVVGVYGSRTANLRARNADLNDQIASLDKQLEDERSAAGEHGSAVAALAVINADIATAEADRSKAQATLDSVTAARADNETALASAKEQLEATEQVLKDVESELANYQVDVDGMAAEQEKARVLEAKVSDLNKQIQALEGQRADLVGLITETSQNLEDAVKDLAKVRGRLTQ